MKFTKTIKSYLISLVWSFCEATFFFIIPDVWLSFSSMESLKKGLKNIFFALIGALLGGTVMYLFGRQDIDSVTNFLVKIPDINLELLEHTKKSIQSEGLASPLVGPIKRVPYKIYAAYYGGLSLSYIMFMMISIPARLIRFLITILLSNFMFRVLLKKISLKKKRQMLIIIWVIIYIIYFNSI
jgi:membrane protein YqaA with SNARE-associated domain